MDQTRTARTLFGFRLRTLAAVVIVVTIGAAALALDLASEGLVYEYLWDVTGETAPEQQLLGFAQYLMRYTRAQPETAPFARIPQADVNPYGVNTFLDQEVLPDRRERQVQLAAEAGFGWLRQQFRWDDLEIDGKGDFIDRRHDRDGDGDPDAISSWEKYDHIVALAEKYGLDILARLSDPPLWSQPEGVTNYMTPPEDFQDFVDYAVAVAERYRGRLRYYQVWNEPNLYPEWGDQTVNAEAYTDLLCRTYHALKAVDPAIVVVTGALGPTVDLSGRNAYDLLYLQRMYQAGAGDCFDVLSVQGYGLWSGPTDRRLRQVTVNYQRHLWIRDMMVAHGDAHKAIWISEAGWNPVPNDPAIADLERYGHVSMQQAAEWGPLAYARAIEEWPWIGVVNWWFLKRADESEVGQSWYYFRLLEPDFTPTPVYEALKSYMTGDQPKTLGAGRHGVDHHGVTTTDARGRTTRAFRVTGTQVYICPDAPAEATPVSYTLDGDSPETLILPAESTACVRLGGSLRSGLHTLAITAGDWSALDSIAVIDHTARHRLPWLVAGGLAAGLALIVLAHAVWVRLGRPPL